MSNSYFTPTSVPATSSRGVSANIRSEIVAVEAGFDKLPTPAQLWGYSGNYATAGGSADAWTASIATAYLTSFVDGMQVRVKFTAANTTAAPTINLNSLGNKVIASETGSVLGVGDIAAGMIATLTYNSTSGKFHMTSTAVASAAAAASAASSASSSASSASASAAAAAASASGAAASATAAEASRDAIDNRIYPGSYASDPTTRPDGTASQSGDEYFNSSSNLQKRFNGTSWVASDINTANLAASTGATLIGYAPAATDAEFWPSPQPTAVKTAVDYLAQRVGAYDYNLLDPKWGIIQKLTNGTVSVRAEIQAVLDYAAARRNVSTDTVNKAKVYAPGATYPLDGTLYIPSWVIFEGERANYEFFGACLWGLSGFNSGAGGDLVRVKSTVDPTSGASFWGGGFTGFNMRGAPDGSVNYGFNTVNETGNNVELQDTACLDFLSARFLTSGGIRLYGGVPSYIRRFRPYCLNGPGITIIGNVGQHMITHLQEISGDQCNGGLVRLENLADADVITITALKSERTTPLHAFNHATTDSFYTTVRGWQNAGHDGQKNAITFVNCTGGRVIVNGAHHISAWNLKQITTYVGDTFTMPAAHKLTDGDAIRFALVSTGTLPTGIVAATDYYVKVVSSTTFKIAAAPGDVAAGPYISPTGGSGSIYGDPGYMAAGDLFGVTSGRIPNLSWRGCFVRYRPYASGGVERIGAAPQIISAVPIGDNTGTTPRTATFPIAQHAGEITYEAPFCVVTTGSSAATRPSKFIVGDVEYTVSDLNEDSVIASVGNLPAFALVEEDAATNNKVTLLRANGDGFLITAVNETDGSFTNWVRFGREADGTASNVVWEENQQLNEGVNVVVGTTTGSRIGTSTAQKLGFWNAAPIAQPASANQAAVSAPAAFVNTNGAIGGLTISAAYAQAEVQALRDACEVLADDCRALRDKVATYETLLTAMRSAFVSAGLIKGSA